MASNLEDYKESVRIKRLVIIPKLDKHVDRLFAQIIDRIGTIEKIEIKAPPRQSDLDTVCYVSLVDRSKHATLIYLLNNYVFHGRKLIVTPAAYTIRTLSSSYTLDPIHCNNCEQYADYVQRGEIEIMKKAIRNTITEVYQQQLAIAQLANNNSERPARQQHQFQQTNNAQTVSNAVTQTSADSPSRSPVPLDEIIYVNNTTA